MRFTTRLSLLSLILATLLGLYGCADGEGGGDDGGNGGGNPTPLAITTTSLPGGTVGTAYTQLATAAGGTGSGYTWAVTLGALPGGVTLADGTPSATLSGTPTGPGTFNFTLQVTDDGSNTATQALSIVVAAAPGALSINTVALPGGSVGVAYATGLMAGGGSGAGYTWAVVTGALPGGLSLTSGTPQATLAGAPTAAGTFNFTVEVTDSASATAQRAYQVTVISTPLSIVTSSLPAAITGQAYSQPVSAAGGTTPYTWSLISSNPASTFAVVSGTPSATIQGTHATAAFIQLTIQVTDASSTQVQTTLLLQVAAPVSIYYQAPTGAALGQPYSMGITTSGGSGNNYQWSISAGSLPPGLALSGGTPSAAISGTPNSAGSYNFTVQVQDGALAATQAYTINVGNAVTITTASLPNATNGTAYSQTVTASGGNGSFTWTLTGTLPTGLNMTSGSPSATISGTATASGQFSFWLKATDGNGLFDSHLFTLTVNAGAGFAITTTTLADGTVGSNYAVNLTATAAATWTLPQGSLPQGVTLSAAGLIGGTPGFSGDFTFTVRADAGGGVTDQRVFTLHVDPAASPLTITTSSLPGGTTGIAYSVTLTAVGGTGSGFNWSITSGTPHAGLSLAGATLSGTPSAGGTASLTFLLTDSGSNTDSITLDLAIAQAGAALSITTTSLPGGAEGNAYAEGIDATGGTPPYSWTVVSGSIPAGTTLTDGTPGAALAGNPVTGAYSFVVQVTDSAFATASANFSVTIAAAGTPLEITTQLLAPPVLGAGYSQQVNATGGSGANVWSVEGGILPYGLTLNTGSPSASLSGTPTVTGAYRFALKVRDSNGATSIKTYTVVVGLQTAVVVEYPEFAPPAIAGSVWSFTFRALGGSNYTWSLGSGLPAGWNMTPAGNTATVSGTVPTSGTTITVFLNVLDTGSGATAMAGWSFASRASGLAPRLDSGSTTRHLPGATLDKAYRVEMGGDYGTGTGQAWSVVSGQLPPGLVLNQVGSAAMIEGVPLAAGTYNFALMLEDSGPSADIDQFEIRVGSVANLYGADLGNASVFVLDRSGSMFGNRYRTMRREVENAVLAMEDSQQFDMVPFESTVQVCFGTLRDATPDTRAEALAFIQAGGLAPAGGTATYPALQYALSNHIGLDTLVLASDGFPNIGGTSAQILADFPAWWQPHTGADLVSVGIGVAGTGVQTFLAALAAQAGGTYIDR